MQVVIVALLALIVLIMLGVLGPMLFVVLAGVASIGRELLIIGGLFVAGLVCVIIWHAANGTL